MEAFIWILFPVFVAAGSALLAFFVMQARMEVAIARERETLAQTQATLDAQEKILQEKLKATEASAKNEALNEMLGEFRIEERHYMRESKTLFGAKKAMVLQERLFFRNMPLSNWVEHEMTVEEGGDLSQLAKACSIFSAKGIGEGAQSNLLVS